MLPAKDKKLIMTKSCNTQKMIKKLAIPLLDHAQSKKNPQDDAAEQVAQIIENSKREFSKFRRNPHRNDGLTDTDVQKLRGRMYRGNSETYKINSIVKHDDQDENRAIDKLFEARSLKAQLQDDYDNHRLHKGSLTTRPGTSLRSSFQSNINPYRSVNNFTLRTRPASFISRTAGHDTEQSIAGDMTYRLRQSLAYVDYGSPADMPDDDCQAVLAAERFVNDAEIKHLRRPKSSRQLQETIKVKENKGLFSDKIRHYSRIYNPKQKSKLVFDKIGKKPGENGEKKNIKVMQVALKDYEREINQRLNTFSTFAMSTSGWFDSRPFKRGLESIQKKAGMLSAIKPMGVSELWSKQFHAEVMNKAQHKKFRLRIQRYLHILHRQGQGNASISRIMLNTHVSKPEDQNNNAN